jgi:3-phosphoshikimate 1-carboxyvinyltransferase
MPIASAQVKGAVLLAGLYAAGRTCVIEPGASRDHSERMLKLFKAKIKVKGNTILIEGRQELSSPGKIYIPGDISSASFFMLLAAISPQAHLVLEKIGLNHSRYGIIRVLKRMGANLRVKLHRAQESGSEPMGDISIRSSKLTGVTVKKKEIPSLIDELPVLMAAACFAKGRSVFEGAGELRVKETDRIRSMSENLRKMGASISVCAAPAGENIIIIGKGGLRGAKVKSFGDHRTAMSIVVAGLAASGQTHLDDISCIRKSFPDFIEKLKSVTVG